MASCAVHLESSMTSSSIRPSMPPAALISSAASSFDWDKGTP